MVQMMLVNPESEIEVLRARLLEAGCFRPARLAYAVRIVAVIGGVSAGYAGLLAGPGGAERLALAGLVAFASVQAAFIAHDVGDGAVTGNRTVALWLRQLLMSFVAGTSSSYFHFLHRMHHATVARGRSGPGEEGFAVNPYEIVWLKRAVSWNGLVFLCVTVCLRAITFRLESLRFLARTPAATKRDRLLIALHHVAWLAVPAAILGVAEAVVNYLMIALLAGPYIGLVLVVNHEGMSKAHEHARLPLLERVLKTTRNLGASRWNDLLFGGVNNHVEHHLFPEIPVVRLGEARRITRAFCRERGYHYEETGVLRALRSAAGHFARMPREQLAREALS